MRLGGEILFLFPWRERTGKLVPVKSMEWLRLWCDGTERTGPENMAVDEWLAETVGEPLLRVYRWRRGWGSLGYFTSYAEARASFPDAGLAWVRRWTGGGVVNHTEDWTYTLAVPCGYVLARMRGAESYRVVHEALARVLADEGAVVRLSSGGDSTGVAVCFQNPVGYDVVDESARKLAGAGQRRSRFGLLHQGSVAGQLTAAASSARAGALARALAREVETVSCEPPCEWLAERVESRYGRETWLRSR